jgi:hypothetical protein
MEERELIVKNIIKILDENGTQLDLSVLKLVNSTSKYSSKQKSIWHLYYNDKFFVRKDKLIFKYMCVTCNSLHEVSTTQFLRKLNKNSQNCNLCKNLVEQKRKAQSEYMKSVNGKPYTPSNDSLKIKFNLLEEKIASLESFEKLDDDFKHKYFSFHLTIDDFNRISKNLISLHNGNLSNMSSYEFWPIFKTNNQMRFTSVFYDLSEDKIFKAHQPILKCDSCLQTWRAKSLEKFKNCIKIMCKDCSFVSKTFKIRNTCNIYGNNIVYQSKLELKFINWCNENKILVNNGPKIKYFFADKERFYRVDFQIKQTLIEIKDNHVWHKNDLKSGKWKSKEDAVYVLINQGSYDRYLFIEPKNWNQSLTIIDKI